MISVWKPVLYKLAKQATWLNKRRYILLDVFRSCVRRIARVVEMTLFIIVIIGEMDTKLSDGINNVKLSGK